MVTPRKEEKPIDNGAAPVPVPGPDVERLEDIAALASVVDAPRPAPELAAQDAQNEANEVAEIAAALELMRAAAIPFAPDHVQKPLERLWDDSQLKRVAEALIQLCRHHGLTVSDFFQSYGPYIQLLAALGMPMLATLKLLKSPPPQPPQNGQQQPA